VFRGNTHLNSFKYSLNSLSEKNQKIINSYFEGLTESRFKREKNILDSLKNQFPGEEKEILEALLHLITNGDLRGNKVYEPASCTSNVISTN